MRALALVLKYFLVQIFGLCPAARRGSFRGLSSSGSRAGRRTEEDLPPGFGSTAG